VKRCFGSVAVHAVGPLRSVAKSRVGCFVGTAYNPDTVRCFRVLTDRAARAPALRHVVALIAYGGIACCLLLPKLLPIRPGQLLSNSPADGSIFLWSLGWWPHAVTHGSLLPYTHAVFAPGGTNLAWTTSIPLPSLLLAPVTRTFGTFAAFNALSLLAPTTAAWTTYLLVHRLTRRWWPSLAAGLVFALSPLETREVAIGHVNLSLVALVPLAAYLVVRELEGSLRPAAFVPMLGLVLAGEIGVSTEIFATTSLFGLIALLLVYAWDRPRRPALRRCAKLVGLGYAAAALLASPMLYAAFAMPHPRGLSSVAGSPTPFSGIRTHIITDPIAIRAGLLRQSIAGSLTGQVLVAIPLLAVLLHLVWRRRRGPVVRALAATAVVALACSPGIVVVGATVIPSPWALVTHVPLLRLVRPQRLTMFAWLIASVGVGVWLAERQRSWRRWGAAALVLAAMLPAMWLGSWTTVVVRPPFFADARRYLASGGNVAIVAGPGPGSVQLEDLAYPTVWQVDSGFSFRLADAYVGSFPPELPTAVSHLVFGKALLPDESSVVLAWLRRAEVRAILVMRPTQAAVWSVSALLGADPLWLGGVALFRVAQPQP
jgi:hypothetical protein